jgi:hypothetical protein
MSPQNCRGFANESQEKAATDPWPPFLANLFGG